MAVKKTGIGSWFSTLTNDTYDSELAARHYDHRELQRSTPESAESKLLDSLSTEQLKSLYIEMNVRSDQAARNQDWREVQEEFVAANPNFLPNAANGSALAAVLMERGKLTPDGTFLGTMDDMQEAYIDLANRNVLQMRPGTRRPKRTEEDPYELPMGDLMDRARGF